MADRCGPKRSMIFSSSTGSVATGSPFDNRPARRERLVPGASLRQTEQAAAAPWTNQLIVLGAAGGIHVVREPQLPFDDDEVADHHRRRERLAAAPAAGLLEIGRAHV